MIIVIVDTLNKIYKRAYVSLSFHFRVKTQVLQKDIIMFLIGIYYISLSVQ